MAGHLIYHWKHGWIPLTHAAALSKAHGSAHLANKYVPGASQHHSSLVTRGKSAREIQSTLDPHGRRPSAPDAGAAERIAQNTAAHPVGSRVNFREGAGHLQTGAVIGHSDRGVIVRRDAGGEEVTRLAEDLGRVRSTGHVPVRGHGEPPRPVEMLKRGQLEAELRHPGTNSGRAAQIKDEITRRDEARAAGSPRRGLNDYGTRYDNPTRLQAAQAAEVSRSHEYTPAKGAAAASELQAAHDARQQRREAELKAAQEQSTATAARLGMTFPEPTVQSHGLVGEGATVGSDARATIEHSGDGTLLSIDRTDVQARAAAKAAGFKWSSNLGSWYLPRNWSESTRRQKVAQLRTQLGDEHVHVNDAGRGATTTAAEREAQSRAHAADRAERMDARAQRAATEADVKFGRAKAIGDMIPFGQPILVGHHSEGRHRRDLARIDSNMRKGFEAQQESAAAAHSAENARRTAAGDSPLVRQRRIDRNEAEVRKIDRALKDHELAQKISATGRDPRRFGVYPTDAGHIDQMTTRRGELADQIQHDRTQIDAAGFHAPSSSDIAPGDVIHYRGSAHVVSKVNQKTVSVPTGYSWDDKVPINQITRHTPMAQLSDSALKSAANAAKNNPKVRAALLRELGRRGIHVGDLTT